MYSCSLRVDGPSHCLAPNVASTSATSDQIGIGASRLNHTRAHKVGWPTLSVVLYVFQPLRQPGSFRLCPSSQVYLYRPVYRNRKQLSAFSPQRHQSFCHSYCTTSPLILSMSSSWVVLRRDLRPGMALNIQERCGHQFSVNHPCGNTGPITVESNGSGVSHCTCLNTDPQKHFYQGTYSSGEHSFGPSCASSGETVHFWRDGS